MKTANVNRNLSLKRSHTSLNVDKTDSHTTPTKKKLRTSSKRPKIEVSSKSPIKTQTYEVNTKSHSPDSEQIQIFSSQADSQLPEENPQVTPQNQFLAWNDALNLMKKTPNIPVDYLFDGPYNAETANERFEELKSDKTSNLSVFMERMESTWQNTATPQDINALRTNMETKLKSAWQRMSQGDTYKLQMIAEALCLQPGGGHHQSPELKTFVENMEQTITDFRDGNIYDGTNAIDPDNIRGEVKRSSKKVVSVESTYKGRSGNETIETLKDLDIEPGVIRNTTNIPDITLSNLTDDTDIHVELEIKTNNGKSLKDSVAFSDGTYSFHGASVEMESRDQKITDQLKNGEFEDRIDAYVKHNLEHGRSHENLAITGDANLCLFDDDPKLNVRTLKPGVQQILNKHNLALIIPSGKVTWGRPISDQLHKNATSKELDGYRDTMLLMVPVTENNINTIKELGNNPALKQDTFFPATMIGGKQTETPPVIHRIATDRKQFSLDFNDRVMTDHAILTGPNHIVGNTADCKGIGTPGKSLTYNGAKSVWGSNIPPEDQYHQMMLDTTKELALVFECIHKGIPLHQAENIISEE